MSRVEQRARANCRKKSRPSSPMTAATTSTSSWEQKHLRRSASRSVAQHAGSDPPPLRLQSDARPAKTVLRQTSGRAGVGREAVGLASATGGGSMNRDAATTAVSRQRRARERRARRARARIVPRRGVIRRGGARARATSCLGRNVRNVRDEKGEKTRARKKSSARRRFRLVRRFFRSPSLSATWRASI